MTCAHCGRRAKGQLCRDCERDHRAEQRAREALAVVEDDDEDLRAVRGDETSESDERDDEEAWSPTEPVDHSDIVPLDMARNITDERVKTRIEWVDGFGRAYASALDGGGR